MDTMNALVWKGDGALSLWSGGPSPPCKAPATPSCG